MENYFDMYRNTYSGGPCDHRCSAGYTTALDTVYILQIHSSTGLSQPTVLSCEVSVSLCPWADTHPDSHAHGGDPVCLHDSAIPLVAVAKHVGCDKGSLLARHLLNRPWLRDLLPAAIPEGVSERV